MLENAVSGLSGADGMATFKDMKILGSASMSSYILISVDGIVVTWTSIYNPSNVNFILPPRGILPFIIAEGSVDWITIITSAPTTIEEGKTFTVVIKAESMGSPKAGATCFAFINEINGAAIPLGYKQKINGPNKDLMFPIAGTYSESDGVNGQNVVPAKTGSDGKITFKNLKFNTRGVQGYYGLMYSCGGYNEIEPALISVTTSITDVKFAI